MTLRLSIVLAAALSLAACKKKPPEAAGATPEAPTDAASASGAEAAPASPMLPSEAPEERLQRVMAASVETLKLGDPTRAPQVIEDLKALTSMAPDAAEIPYNIGIAYELLGDDTNARKAYLRATDVDPSLGAAWLNLGAMAEERGEYDRALQSYEAGLRHDPENGDLVVGVIGALRRQGRYAQAVTEAKRALGQNANNVNIYNNLGLVYLAQGQTELASFVYQKALNSVEGASNNAYLHANLGKVYLARDEDYLAQQELEQALRLDPRMVPAMVDLAQLHMDDRNWSDAATLLERARTESPSDAAILINLGICYRGLGRLEEAQALYQQALELDPRNADPYLNMAVLQGDYMRAYDAALASIDRYVAAGGQNRALADTWRAELTDAKGKYEKELERKRKREEREAKRKAEEAGAAEYQRILAERQAKADAMRGQACPAEGCADLLACNRQSICVDEGSPGTIPVGGACQAETDCASGLICGPEKTCVAPDPAAAPTPAPEAVPAPAPAAPTEAPPIPTPASPDPWGGAQ
ncbi:tetratricopeptide repeat protein [Myxococcota bacterium]|nr:tetratricopeptide repeat protein [Myxococcota bacterium]